MITDIVEVTDEEAIATARELARVQGLLVGTSSGANVFTAKKMAEKYEGQMKIGKLDVEDSMDIAQKYRVMNIPTFIFFKNGEVVETHVGGMNASELEAKIQQHLA